MIFFFGAYVWMMSSGNERIVIEQGKNLYRAFIAWLDDAEVDYQIANPQPKKSKKRSRRWD